MDLSFEELFNRISNKQENVKFVVILGSGFHKNAFEKRDDNSNCLTKWHCLLEQIDSTIQYSGNYILDFEKIILKNTKTQNKSNASKIESDILKCIARNIKDIQNKVLKDEEINYPISIFNNRFISDVISLNFDLIPEIILTKKFNSKVKYVNNSNKKESRLNSTRHRTINGINFWHPHGDVSRPDSMLLGARKYSLNLTEVEKLRKRSKLILLKSNYVKTWYDLLAHSPILILGAEVSDLEWDVWSAILNRERNFAKKENWNKFRYPIFQMRQYSNNETKQLNSNEIWFNPLFNNDIPFEIQWKKLTEILSDKNL